MSQIVPRAPSLLAKDGPGLSYKDRPITFYAYQSIRDTKIAANL